MSDAQWSMHVHAWLYIYIPVPVHVHVYHIVYVCACTACVCVCGVCSIGMEGMLREAAGRLLKYGLELQTPYTNACTKQ